MAGVAARFSGGELRSGGGSGSGSATAQGIRRDLRTRASLLPGDHEQRPGNARTRRRSGPPAQTSRGGTEANRVTDYLPTTTVPPFITARTFEIATLISASGSPSTA